ncbi:related to 2,5-diketo-D-gluconic acid reductase [Serendipita indica DSM 11827]|uniref:Related to 2,5-diketo-D-gluconic acid reductase n=1 Tax=Serendipita indica (strain DSM 11827) TaxID=1109443 RepID=G4TEE2_SERID|nr:related to 2,5-diketo-D-gluconic acid reductase [Serendipita indica DSM 11827]
MSTSNLTLDSRIRLKDGREIPHIGFGVYEMSGEEAYRSVTIALEARYRLIDSAAWYGNEAECAKAIIDFCTSTNTPRSSIWFTTKLQSNRGYSATKRAIETSFEKCRGLEYIDLYLIHSPLGGPQMRKESWKAVLEAKEEGKLRSVGVSNYGVAHLDEMMADGVEMPVINQVDLHPFMTRDPIVERCRELGIVLEAWGPVVRGLRFKHPTIVELAKRHSKSPAQILLRYSLQRGYIPLPKSVTKERIIENKNLYDFELSDKEMETLHSLDEYLVTDWDVTNAD